MNHPRRLGLSRGWCPRSILPGFRGSENPQPSTEFTDEVVWWYDSTTAGQVTMSVDLDRQISVALDGGLTGGLELDGQVLAPLNTDQTLEWDLNCLSQ